jgi:7-cyano-7-deazaguanine synthase
MGILDSLPDDANGSVVVLSGGMDSTIAMRLCVEKYGSNNVRSLSFYYGQKQAQELEKAAISSNLLGVKHKICNLSILGEIGQGFSANLDASIAMPSIHDVLGDPRPKTYVPNRNMILMSIAAAYAEVENIDTIVMGLQVHDEYSYHDTTQRFVNKVNDVLAENRIIKIRIIAPFSTLSKQDEIRILSEIDGNVDLLQHTLTCYNPNENGESCGKCPSCSERINAFMQCGIKDPIPYSIVIPWEKYIKNVQYSR